MMNALTKLSCQACEGGLPALTDEAMEAHINYISDEWHIQGDSLSRVWRFKTFKLAWAFAEKVAKLAEDEHHHPTMTIAWGKVDILLTTHAVGGLTLNDFICAAKIDELNE